MDMNNKRIVAVFAHPDDESFGPGGTLARYAAEGVDLTLVCGTRGESGTIGHSSSYGPALLARIRQAELEAAAEVLGIKRLHILGYPDRDVSAVGVERGVGDVLGVLQEVAPDVVIAFHPTGISGHPDHQAMTIFATTAVGRLRAEAEGAAAERAAAKGAAADWRSRLALHYYTIPASVTRQITWREMPLVPDEEITIELDTSKYAEVKRRAIHCHKTQLAFLDKLTSVPGADGRFAIERYATFGAAGGGPRGNDLFAGGNEPAERVEAFRPAGPA